MDWKQGEYPAIDDIWSWLHLSVIALDRTGKQKKSPVVPELVYEFRLGYLGKIAYFRQTFGVHAFFKIYGTTELKVAAQKEWLSFLSMLSVEHGPARIKALFPGGVQPLKTKAHTNEHIRALLEHLRTPQDTPVVFTPSSTGPQEPSAPPKPQATTYQKENFAVSKTFDESLLSNANTAPALQPEIPLSGDFDYQALTSTTLPREGTEEVMGSGVSCGIIGEGGMATVYKVRVEDLEMLRAGKVLIPGKVCQSAEQAHTLVERYRDEAKVTAQLHHTNVVLVHLFGKFRGHPYIEMEYVDGSDLGKLIQTKGRAPMELFSALSILSLRGLAYAHNESVILNGKEHRGVMHRDIKPANLLVDLKKGNVKLTDFGLARPPAVSVHTAANHTLGTLGYMSPEQLESNNVDTRTDIYSFGATMYEMLAGQPLFPQDRFMDLMKARQANAYRPLSSTRKKVHKDVLHIIDKCLNYDPDQRIQSADTLMDHLEDFHHKVSKERPEAILQDYVLGKRYFHTNGDMKGQKKALFGGLLGR